MKNFTKSILNYFAAYTETRFRFQTKIDYKWTNDSLTCDFSAFPDFEKEILSSLKNSKSLDFVIKQKDYTVSLDAEKFKSILIEKLSKNYTIDFINNCIKKKKKRCFKLKVML